MYHSGANSNRPRCPFGDHSISTEPATSDSSPPSSGGASRIAAGILSSRVLGLVREAVLLRYLGAGPHLDAFKQALRSGNLIQNLLGEQTLSAAFIPIYSRMLEEGREEDAGRFAGAVFGLLMVLAGALTLVGVFGASAIVTIFNPGYLQDATRVAGEVGGVDRFPLAVRLVRWLFPMAGVLVLSAWSVGVLNSHRRFFMAYFAPVLWNVAIISALWFAGRPLAAAVTPPESGVLAERILMAGAIGALVGGALQFLVQLPLVARVLRGFRWSLSTKVRGVREALRAFWPMLAGRGAVQISGHLDGFIASFLVAGAQGVMGSALTLYLLPLSLFGLAVAAAELPEMSRRANGDELPRRIESAVSRSAFLVIPTAVGYVAFGLLIVGGLFGHGEFGRVDRWLLYLVLAAYSLGLPASGVTRQLNTAFYALGRTRVPARAGIERMLLSAGVGGLLAVYLDRFRVDALVGAGLAGSAGGASSASGSGSDAPLFLGALGLAMGGAVGAWFELTRIRRKLMAGFPGLRLPARNMLVMAACAAVSVLPAGALWYVLDPRWPDWTTAPAVVAVYALAYLALAHGLGVSQLDAWLAGMPGRKKG